MDALGGDRVVRLPFEPQLSVGIASAKEFTQSALAFGEPPKIGGKAWNNLYWNGGAVSFPVNSSQLHGIRTK